MSQIFLYCLHIITGLQRNHCVRMAQIVESDILHVQFRHNELECTVQRLGCYPVADLVREDQTVLQEVTSEILSVGILCLLRFPKQIHHKGCCGDGALLAVLSGNQSVLFFVTPYLTTQTLQLLIDKDGSVVEPAAFFLLLAMMLHSFLNAKQQVHGQCTNCAASAQGWGIF